MNKKIKNLSIVFVGAGNLATNVAKALYKQGFHIAQVYSRTQESAKTLADMIDAKYTTQLHELKSDADLYIISLKDTAFVQLIGDICKDKNPNRSEERRVGKE